jgi:isopenicillin N synthase-like dioxygenase
MGSSDSIPCLRLSDYTHADESSRRAFAGSLRKGLEDFGFVTVVDHGVSRGLIEQVYLAAASFFELSDEEKLRSAGVAGGARGFTPFGVEHAKDASTPDLKEFFHVGREVEPLDPMANRWPSAAPALERSAPRLFDALEECSRVLLAALAVAYDLPEAVFADMVRGGNHVLRALHYPPLSDESSNFEPAIEPGSLRAAPHEDINLITLLCGSSEPGLEILRPDGEWMAVRAEAEEIVVDAGDMLARVTNGEIPATTHRVVNPPGSCSRYSLPFFAHPRPECDLSVLAAFQSADSPPRTPPTTAGEFLEQRLREIGLTES